MDNEQKAEQEDHEDYMEILGNDTCPACGREDYETAYICCDCGYCDSCGCKCYEREFHDEAYDDYDPEDYR